MLQTHPYRHALLIVTAGILSACASNTPPPVAAPEVPAALRLAPTYRLTMFARARGVQVYQCGVNKDDARRFSWNFKAPEADLFDAVGNPVGKHYAGPTWESRDGSKVVGQVKANDPGPEASAIPWLLLDAKSNSGSGVFTAITAIQRVRTTGGKAPPDDCGQAQQGNEMRVPYTAEYYFYTGQG